ncbi:hypothetical protein [Bradyrhizobium yuanmingense]|uniref:hypothetical protein n=1 Tax=Bradyrhizobium yuanmingense TaxID=108015 RepID=UPI0023B9D5D8|nr:hypothetical protein [Bradyrhizobium yuanmingense]MDF0496541.1 hypothetical protein [Bradyrhizobium yuanmingense]
MLPLPSPWRHLPPPVVSAKRLRRTFSRRYPTFLASRFHLALFTGKRQTDRLVMRNESDVEGRHAFRQSKTGELVDIKEAPQLSTRLNSYRGAQTIVKHYRARNAARADSGIDWLELQVRKEGMKG